MRYLILSDIHANIDALDTVLESAPADTWDRAIVLGDLVGYGAEPAAVIERVRALNPLATIRGNHDKAACGIEDGSSFNYVARLAAQWTFESLSPENRQSDCCALTKISLRRSPSVRRDWADSMPFSIPRQLLSSVHRRRKTSSATN